MPSLTARLRSALAAVRSAYSAAEAPETRVLGFVSGCHRRVEPEQPPAPGPAPFRHRAPGGS